MVWYGYEIRRDKVVRVTQVRRMYVSDVSVLIKGYRGKYYTCHQGAALMHLDSLEDWVLRAFICVGLWTGKLPNIIAIMTVQGA